MDYAAAVAELQRRGRFGINLGLERIQRLLDELDHPERALRGALVGGTNGKGSVVALVGAALREAGMRVGSMPKPHLVSYRERIAIDGRPISERDFAEAVTRALPAVERAAPRHGEPTEFEFLTAAAVLELARRHIDVAVVEVGLGGRLDATNALDLGVAAITNVQHDHERHLGRTLRRIGTEKAAIIKRGNAAVTGARPPGLVPIVERCAALGVPLRRAAPDGEYRVRVHDVSWDGLVIDAERPAGPLRDLRVGLLGRHQAQNAAVALGVLDAMRDRWEDGGLTLPGDDGSVRRGFADARWPGRLELVPSRRPGIGPVLLDGAHNPAGARVLRDALRDLGLVRPALVFGAIRGKRVSAILRALAELEPSPVFTRVPSDTAVAPAALAAAWSRLTGRRATVEPDPLRAVERAAAASRSGDPVVVCGSLYLVGAVRAVLVPEAAAA